MSESRPFLIQGFSSDDLARNMGTNRRYLSRAVNMMAGKSIRDYINYYRVMYAAELWLRNPALKVSALSDLSGFTSPDSFSDAFKKVMKKTPTEWRSTGGSVLK